MKFLLINLNQKDITKLEESGINWYHDELSNEIQEYTVVFDSDDDRTKAMKFLNIKNHSGYYPAWL